MDKEQELLAMIKYICREKPYTNQEISPNVFVLVLDRFPIVPYYCETKKFNIDFAKQTAEQTYVEPVEMKAHSRSIEWDLFVLNAHEYFTKEITKRVQSKIEQEKRQKEKCELQRRIALELRPV